MGVDHKDDVGVAETMQSGEHTLPRRDAAASLSVETSRYALIEVLGRGGMGEVHKAWDPQLGRHVALKVMREASPHLAARLVQEARAQARVEHAHVCKVYGVGELNGMPFIALQYIEGKTLHDAAAGMTREQRVAVMRDVAEGLHAAHRQGLVHRDVKPANILIEQTDAGYHAYITDFGIAREVDAPGLTKTGMAQGTPLYMAPEQARGEAAKIDRRTDVYGLGVTLYELLSGRRPFEGDTSLGVILKVLEEDAPALRTRDPSIPLDLETVTMKCLEKEPTRRYDSARALAEDLQSWLDGEPIQARRSSLGYRLVKRARKHIALVSAAMLLAVAGAAVGGYSLHARRVTAEQTRLAHAFGQEVERNDAIARYSALLPLHDTRRERQMIEARMANLERRMVEIGSAADGPGRYALGRGWLVLDRPDDARRELERAWATGYHTPEVSYALGLALGQQYQRALVESEHGDKQTMAAKREALAHQFRDPAKTYLKAAGGVGLEAPEYVEGLIALHEQRYLEALAKARAAQDRVPWMYEARTLEGDIRLTLARERSIKGEPDEALVELDRAGDAYRAASQVAHSSARALQGDCERFMLAAEIRADRDQSPQPQVDGAVTACEQALKARPDDAELYLDQFDAWLEQARYDLDHNGAVARAWDAAGTAASTALRLAPQSVRAQLAMASLEKSRASWEIDHGADPRERLQRVLAAVREVARQDPRSHDARWMECSALWKLGDWQGAHGVDPRPSYQAAAAAGKAALGLPGAGFKTWNEVGVAYLGQAMWEVNAGFDPRPALAQAAEAYDHVVAANPNVDYGYINLCATWQTVAEYESQRGIDPTATLQKAFSACDKARTVDPDYAGTHINVAIAHMDLANWQVQHNIDPSSALAQARTAAKRAIEVDPASSGNTTLGSIELVAARWATEHGRSPLAPLDLARGLFDRALERNAEDAETLGEMAEEHRWRAAWKEKQHEPVEPEIRQGLERATQALRIHPRLATAAQQEGALELIRARVSTGTPRKQAAERARTALERALALNANLEREVRPLIDEANRLR